jgi:hypothetical protein
LDFLGTATKLDFEPRNVEAALLNPAGPATTVVVLSWLSNMAVTVDRSVLNRSSSALLEFVKTSTK